MLEIYYAPSFLRILKKLPVDLRENVRETALEVIELYTSGKKTSGLGIKNLRGKLWEARTDIRTRIIYEIIQNRLTFILAGSHDDILNFLKRH